MMDWYITTFQLAERNRGSSSPTAFGPKCDSQRLPPLKKPGTNVTTWYDHEAKTTIFVVDLRLQASKIPGFLSTLPSLEWIMVPWPNLLEELANTICLAAVSFREGYSHHSQSWRKSVDTHWFWRYTQNDTKTSAPETHFGGAPREQITLLDPPSSKDSPQRYHS